MYGGQNVDQLLLCQKRKLKNGVLRFAGETGGLALNLSEKDDVCCYLSSDIG